MTRTLLFGAGSLWLVLLAGCTSGPLGPRTSYTSVPVTRTGQPVNHPPIATQPVIAPTGMTSPGTASPVRVVPFAALPRHAMVQVQQGIPFGSGAALQTGVRPLAMLASNGQMVDGRSLPLLQRETRVPASGGSSLRKHASQALALPPSASARVVDLPQTPQEDLRFHGGRTIRDLSYINLYVGGQDSWDPPDWKNIDKALAVSMADPHLNNVIVQYFGNKLVTATFKRSFFLSGWRPQFVAKSDLDRQVRSLHSSGAFSGYDLPNTVVNFMLPRGTVLGDPSAGQAVAVLNKAVPHEEAEDSTGGLGGYHSSVHIGGETVYFAVGVYSERLANGGTNGIPVFDQNWKNVVATFYHELQEARTDPDVEDASNPSIGVRALGWTSDSGLEIGDYPIAEARQLKQVFVEVPLADGSGMVPVQLQYSNAVHGPEGPIPYPHGMEPPPGTQPSNNNPPANSGQPNTTKPPTNNPPPVTTDPELSKVIAQWNQLEDFVKKAIVRLAGSR